MHFFFEALDYPFNLNIYGINTDNISITGPPRLLINGMSFPVGIKPLSSIYNIKTKANNIVKYNFFPNIPQIIGNFDIFL